MTQNTHHWDQAIADYYGHMASAGETLLLADEIIQKYESKPVQYTIGLFTPSVPGGPFANALKNDLFQQLLQEQASKLSSPNFNGFSEEEKASINETINGFRELQNEAQSTIPTPEQQEAAAEWRALNQTQLNSASHLNSVNQQYLQAVENQLSFMENVDEAAAYDKYFNDVSLGLIDADPIVDSPNRSYTRSNKVASSASLAANSRSEARYS